jgi:hypothetical protein
MAVELLRDPAATGLAHFNRFERPLYSGFNALAKAIQMMIFQ